LAATFQLPRTHPASSRKIKNGGDKKWMDIQAGRCGGSCNTVQLPACMVFLQQENWALLQTLPYTYDITNNAADHFHEDIPSLLITAYRMQAELVEK